MREKPKAEPEQLVVKNRNCGYCEHIAIANEKDFIAHVHQCEFIKVNKYYGGLLT